MWYWYSAITNWAIKPTGAGNFDVHNIPVDDE